MIYFFKRGWKYLVNGKKTKKKGQHEKETVGWKYWLGDRVNKAGTQTDIACKEVGEKSKSHKSLQFWNI